MCPGKVIFMLSFHIIVGSLCYIIIVTLSSPHVVVVLCLSEVARMSLGWEGQTWDGRGKCGMGEMNMGWGHSPCNINNMLVMWHLVAIDEWLRGVSFLMLVTILTHCIIVLIGMLMH